MNDFIFYDYVYDNDEILRLKNLCLTSEWNRTNGKANRYYSVVRNYLDPNTLIQKYLNYLPEYSAASLHEGISKIGKYFPDVKLAKYEENDNFGWHCDHWPEKQLGQHMKRQLSSITYLNDDFDGGETEFSCGIVIKPQHGKTLIFPSTWLFPHQGKPVTKGTKYIYVSHIWA